MMVLVRVLALVSIIATGFAAPTALRAEDDGVHKLALQISDNDAEKMVAVLNIAANVSRFYSSIGEEVEIRIIAFNAGMHMLRTDTAPEQVANRVRGFSQSMPNVAFVGCGNTIDSMTRSEGKPPPIIEHSETVEAGVVELITLNEAGWTIVRP
tara:strand:- start:974 stop:1435 length:462 start_codon:yes stop_codon:yes gene_type:complete